MDNKTAFFLALAIIAVFVADHFYLGWDLPLILGRLIASLSEWIAFWR